MSHYTVNLNLNVKVLDFVQFGGPGCTVERSFFEMRLGAVRSARDHDRTSARDAGIQVMKELASRVLSCPLALGHGLLPAV